MQAVAMEVRLKRKAYIAVVHEIQYDVTNRLKLCTGSKTCMSMTSFVGGKGENMKESIIGRVKIRKNLVTARNQNTVRFELQEKQ